MNSLRTRPLRLTLVVTMLLSWFVLTNHCALARMHAQMAAQREAACCHNRQTPVEKTPCKELAQCCQAVKASLSGKAEVKYDSAKFQLQVFALVWSLAAEVAQPERELVFDHGPPPRVVSFAEAVLQRSLLSHAPPLAV